MVIAKLEFHTPQWRNFIAHGCCISTMQEMQSGSSYYSASVTLPLTQFQHHSFCF